MHVVRPPELPDKASLSEEDREIFDALVPRITENYGDGTARFEANVFWRALLNSPPLATAVCNLAFTMVATGKRGEGYSDAEREMINTVLSFDAGHYELALHHFTSGNVERAGIRPGAIRALWEGHEDDLLADERQLVDFIRAVVSGSVTDEMFDAMAERLDGVRGVTEYTIAISYLLMALTLMRALDAPVRRKEMEDEIDRVCGPAPARRDR
jgi:hypothetical protein